MNVMCNCLLNNIDIRRNYIYLLAFDLTNYRILLIGNNNNTNPWIDRWTSTYPGVI